MSATNLGNAAPARPPDDYGAMLAFDLYGIDLDQPLTPELAATLTIPR